MATVLIPLTIAVIILMSFVIAKQYCDIQELTKKPSVYFEIYKDRGMSWRWRLRKTANGNEIIASSNQGFNRIEKAQEDIERIIEANRSTEIRIIKKKERQTDE